MWRYLAVNIVLIIDASLGSRVVVAGVSCVILIRVQQWLPLRSPIMFSPHHRPPLSHQTDTTNLVAPTTYQPPTSNTHFSCTAHLPPVMTPPSVYRPTIHFQNGDTDFQSFSSRKKLKTAFLNLCRRSLRPPPPRWLSVDVFVDEWRSAGAERFKFLSM